MKLNLLLGLPNNPNCQICNLTKSVETLLTELPTEVSKSATSKPVPVIPKSPPTIVFNQSVSNAVSLNLTMKNYF